MIVFLPSDAGKASSRWYVRSFNSAFLSSTTEGDIIRSLLPIESLLEALLQFFRSFRRNYFWDSFRKQVCRWHSKGSHHTIMAYSILSIQEIFVLKACTKPSCSLWSNKMAKKPRRVLSVQDS